MKSNPLFSFVTALFVSTALLLTTGCGGGEGGTAPDAAEVAALEAKVAGGDADAAMKLGELFAADLGSRESQITAAKWFHIAAKMGHLTASIGVDSVNKGLSGEENLEAERRANAFKLPAKQ